MSVQVIGCLSATVLYLCFFLRLRSCSFGTVWKGCERIVFGLPELGLSWRLAFSDPLPAVSAPCGRVANAPFLAAFFLACVLHALGTKLAAVRGFRKLRIGAFCLAWARILLLFGRFAWAPSRHHGTSADGLAWALLSAPPRTAFGVAVYWFRTQPRSEGAGHKKCFMDSKGDGKHFFWLVFLACLSSACSGVWPFRIRCPRASFLCLCRL